MRTRRPANLDEYKKAFSYVIGRLDRTVVPAHQHYQVRLKDFLRRRGSVSMHPCTKASVQIRGAEEVRITAHSGGCATKGGKNR
jgi:hypothetical protein